MTTHPKGYPRTLLRQAVAPSLILALLSVSAVAGCSAEAPAPTSTPAPVLTTPAPAANPYAGTEVIHKSFEWTYWRFDDFTWTWSVDIPTALYERYRAMPRPQTNDYVVYAADDGDREIIADLARTLSAQADQLQLEPYEKVHFIANFVQKLGFTLDVDTTGFDDYARYPIETLVEEGGDCEDTAILLGKIMSALDYEVVLVRFPTHIALGVLEGPKYAGTYFPYNEGKYFYLETTGEAGRLGIVPPEYQGQSAYIFDFTARPIIVHTWTGSPDGAAYALDVVVENRGSGPIEECHVQAGFDAGNNSIWSAVESEPFDLGAGEKLELRLTLTPPPVLHTRLLVFIVHEGVAVDTSQSKWFDE